MRTSFPLLAALYSFLLAFTAITSAQGQGEALYRRADPSLRTTEQNYNHPSRLAVRQNDDPTESTESKRAAPKFPSGNGRNVPFARMGGTHRVMLRDVDSPDRQVFAKRQQSQQQQQTTLMPPPGAMSNSTNGTNSTAGLMRRWTNPYKLPTTKPTKRSAAPAFPVAKYPPRKARRRWFLF